MSTACAPAGRVESPPRPRASGLARRLPVARSYLLAFGAAALGAGLGRAVITSYLPVLLERIRDAPGLIGTIMLVNAATGFAVPLLVGAWSDRLRSRHGRRRPFILGGAVLTAGGLVAIGLGSSSSYLVLALLGAAAYTGLNAVTTAHRALIPQSFGPAGRPRASSAQETATLVGSLLGVVLGGALIGTFAAAPFVVAAGLVVPLALVTVARVREQAEPAPSAPAPGPAARGGYLRAAMRPGVRAILAAEALWVLGYGALPVFFILYAERTLGLRPGIAALWLAAFGVATGLAIVAAGRVRDPARNASLVVLGTALMGGGFLGASLTASPVPVAAAMVPAAAGFGLISALAFPLMSDLIPEGEEGRYSALFGAVRAIAAAVALPAAGWAIALTGSYRSLFALGGAATLAALVPLWSVWRGPAGPARRRPAWPAWPHRPEAWRWLGTAAALELGALVLVVLVVGTPLERLDHGLFRLVNGLGPAPDLVWSTLNPHLPNYLALVALAAVAGGLTGRRAMPALAVTASSGVLAWALLEGVYLLYDRARPEEVMGGVVLDGNSWRFFSSYPSGHAAVTVALVAAAVRVVPALRAPLWTYVAAVLLTRVLFGAHFPSDVLAGAVVGYVSVGLAQAALASVGVRLAEQGGEHAQAVGHRAKGAVHAVVARRDRHPGDPQPGA